MAHGGVGSAAEWRAKRESVAPASLSGEVKVNATVQPLSLAARDDLDHEAIAPYRYRPEVRIIYA
jgi:hypothetical protein